MLGAILSSNSAHLTSPPSGSVMSLGDGEFHFWTESPLRCHVRRSTDLWKSMEDDYSLSPLLPHDHSYSSPSPSSRRRVIEQGRRELMEMVRHMPESSFELSLKDMVDEQQSAKEARKEEDLVAEGLDKKERLKNGKKRKTENVAGPRMDKCTVSRTCSTVSRTCSLDNGTFMIKMFFPAFLTSRKAKTRRGNRSKSKVSPRTWINGAEARKDCESWSMRSPAAAAQRIHSKHSSSSRSSSCRDGKGEPLPSCWPFEMLKGKMRRRRASNC